MKVMLFELLLVCMLGALHAGANTQPEEMDRSHNGEEQHVGRRYAESTIASELSKIMDSIVQKNFVDYLLLQKAKRSKPAAVEERQYNDLLKLSLHEKQERKI
uniref:Gastric inhibitory polypeptide n=1 Tax=Anabas testudineus TaxID=64144 RepID=A0A7N6AW51_ANATE